jgi:hypothetical protein
VTHKIERVDNLSTCYTEDLLLPTSLECGEIVAPTSQVHAFATAMQMIREYHILWRYAAIQWHNVPMKYREYQ